MTSPLESIEALVRARARGDIDAAFACYEPGATVVTEAGELATGELATRRFITAAAAVPLVFGARQVIEGSGVALHCARWTIRGQTASGCTADILRRGSDGTWRIAVDNAWGVAVEPETERARAVVESFYDGGARGEITSFEGSLDESFELFVPGYLPWGGTFDKAQYVALLPRVAETLDFTKMKYVSLTAEGGHVVALIDIPVFGTDESVVISEHWDVAKGKATRLRVAYFDARVLMREKVL